MSMPLDQQVIQPPPPYLNEQVSASHSGFGRVGPLIAVLAVVTILGVLAGMLGRLCSGRTVMGYGNYGFEEWIERKCASCIDGRISPPPPPPPPPPAAGGGVPVPMPAEAPEPRARAKAEHARDQNEGSGES